MARIYISSTYQDLREHREKVYDALRRLSHDVVAMEDYVATDSRPLEQCLQDVASCEIYVGIFAWRQGFIPPGEKVGITELEYREARKTGKTCLIFLLHDEADWKKSWIDKDTSAIDKLRDELKLAHGISHFSSAEDLATLAVTAVTRSIIKDAPVVVLPTPVPQPVNQGELVRFTTVRLDESGKIVERKEQERPLIVEDLGGVRIELVEISAGEFWMGSTSADAKIAHTEALRWYTDAKEEWYQAETPRHRVRLSSFAMGRYPVTQEEWLEVMGDLPKMKQSLRGDRRPVVNVSWEEAGQFCLELTRRSGRHYRLPTEAEWEYAARAGTTTAYWCGPVLTPEVANYWWSHPFGSVKPGNQLGRTWEVGSSGFANPFGLADMHGNVLEWCSDWHSEKYYAECHAKGTVDYPTGPDGGSNRVLRGGGWFGAAVDCRSALRCGRAPGLRGGYLGFRLVRIGR